MEGPCPVPFAQPPTATAGRGEAELSPLQGPVPAESKADGERVKTVPQGLHGESALSRKAWLFSEQERNQEIITYLKARYVNFR